MASSVLIRLLCCGLLLSAGCRRVYVENVLGGEVDATDLVASGYVIAKENEGATRLIAPFAPKIPDQHLDSVCIQINKLLSKYSGLTHDKSCTLEKLRVLLRYKFTYFMDYYPVDVYAINGSEFGLRKTLIIRRIEIEHSLLPLTDSISWPVD